jgi:cysteine synthase
MSNCKAVRRAVDPAKSPVLSGGTPGPHRIQGIGVEFVPENFKSDLVEEVITVSDEDAGTVTKEVNRLDGIPVGISSGAIIWAALQLACHPGNEGQLIVAIAPSSCERYRGCSTFLH